MGYGCARTNGASFSWDGNNILHVKLKHKEVMQLHTLGMLHNVQQGRQGGYGDPIRIVALCIMACRRGKSTRCQLVRLHPRFCATPANHARALSVMPGGFSHCNAPVKARGTMLRTRILRACLA